MSDKEFMKTLVNQKTLEDARDLLKRQGFDFTENDMIALGNVIERTASKGEPLTEEEMLNICGGVDFMAPAFAAIISAVSAVMSEGTTEEKISRGVGGAILGGLGALAAGTIGGAVGGFMGGKKGSTAGSMILGNVAAGMGVPLGQALGVVAYYRICAWMKERKLKK